MTLRVHTARISYRGADALDITRKGNDAVGVVFAPSWKILNDAMKARADAEECLKGANRDGAVGALHRATAYEIEDRMWAVYLPKYTEEMRESYRVHRDVWEEVLARPKVVLTCFCDVVKWKSHCHRVVLAGLLVKCGAVYEGER